MMRWQTWGLVATMLAVLTTAATAAGGKAKGTIALKAGTVNVTHAYFMKGPDVVDKAKTIRRIVFATKDVEAALRKCETMSCSDGGIEEGMTVDLDSGERLNYWLVARGGLTQYSGTAPLDSIELSTDEPTRVAGKLTFDSTAAGGGKVAVEFDAPFIKEVKRAF